MGIPVVSSPNPYTGDLLSEPGTQFDYPHPVAGRRGTPIPIAFQITSPFDRRTVLLPHMLVMHVNPQNFNEAHTKKIERIQTRGGFVEQHWGDDLSEISADGSTGAFVNIYSGTSSVVRQQTIAWDRYQDLYDLFHNNGSVYDPYGNIVLQGNVMLLYDRGIYIGYFRTFDVEETAESPFAFRVSWTFKVLETVLKIPALMNPPGPAPAFQAQNLMRPESMTAKEAEEDTEGGYKAPTWEVGSDEEVEKSAARSEQELYFRRLAEQGLNSNETPETPTE